MELMARLGFSLLIFLLAIATPAIAQDDGQEEDNKKKRKGGFIVLPLAFYTPETRFGGGLGGVYAFRFKNEADSTLVSQIQAGFAYTQNRQVLSYLPFRLYWNNEDFVSYGEVGYFRYNYFFYGIGNDAPADIEELYDIELPRVQLNMLRRVKGRLYLGGRYWLDAMEVSGFDSSGVLATGNVPGNTGGTYSGLGLVSNYDARDIVFFPRKGIFAESALMFYGGAIGSDVRYTRFTFDFSQYFETPWEHVFAWNAFTDLTWGNTPFFQMPQLGGTKKMRGYYQGRYRDKKLWLLQAEYRAPLIWRLGVVGFADWGMVADGFGDFAFQHSRYTYGGGLRFLLLKKENLNLRIDYGRGKGTGGFYFTVGEAF